MRFLTTVAVALFASTAAHAQSSQFALRFYGTGTNQQDRVRIPIDDNASGANASTPCDVGASSFTIEFWLKGSLLDNATSSWGGDVEQNDFGWINGNVIVDRDIYGGSTRDFGISIAGGRVRFGTGFADNNPQDGENTIEGSTLVLDGNWHHVACVRDVTTGRKQIYVDGVLDFESSAGSSTDDISYPNAGVSSQQTPWGPYLVLGAEKHDAGSSYPSFRGFFDELRVWNVARNAQEILSSLGSVVAAGTPGLVGAYRFEEGAGTVVADSSGAGSSAGQLIAGIPGNGEWVSASVSSANTAPLNSGILPPGFSRTMIASGLNEPTVLAFAPDGRAFVGQRNGTIRIVQGGALLSSPLVQLPADTTNGERGLVGLALDPQFASNGFLYAYWTTNEPRNRVSRLTVIGNTAALGSEFVVWQNPALAADYHHGGCLGFGPDGRLYISTGDQFASSNSQSLANQHGKLLRVASNGSIPADNPFVGVPGAQTPIFALGLRNPFRFRFDSLSGKLYLGDVGGNVSDSWEELNVMTAGANYGWPNQEGATCYVASCEPYTFPKFSYRHDDPAYSPTLEQGSIIVGPVYRGTQFPAPYQGNLFIADYANRWIRRLVLDAGDNVVAQSVFLAPPEGGTIVDLAVAQDGALWYVTLGVPWSGGADSGAIHRIAYTGGANLAPIASASATPQSGPAPLAVQFSSGGSSDPDGGPNALSFLWQFGDGQTSNQPNPTHLYSTVGPKTATLTVSDGLASTSSAPLVIQVGNPPVPVISTPLVGAPYQAGDTLSFSGFATDPEDGVLPASALTWNVVLVHESHTHPFLGPLIGVSGGSFMVPTTGHGPEHTHYEIVLTAVDASGLATTTIVPLAPRESRIVIDSIPSGIPFTLDGEPQITPREVESLVGFQHALAIDSSATVGAQALQFVCWSDGQPLAHSVTAPSGGMNLTAYFAPASSAALTIPIAAANRNADFYTPVGVAFGNLFDANALCAGRDGSGIYQLGCEFALPIPQGSTITSATIEFTATADQTGSPPFTIRAYDVGNAPPFVAGSNAALTSFAPLLSTSVPWSPSTPIAGQTVATPSLSALVQSIVNRPDFTAGNHVGFVIDGSAAIADAWRCFRNYASGQPPRLQVSYSTGASATCSSACGFKSFGVGAAPSHNLSLTGSGATSVGATPTATVAGAESSSAYLLCSLGTTSVPAQGGIVLVNPSQLLFLLTVPLSAGSVTLPLPIPNQPAVAGFAVHFQAIATAPSLSNGFAFSSGLTLTICP